jgi:hypothetical protein
MNIRIINQFIEIIYKKSKQIPVDHFNCHRIEYEMVMELVRSISIDTCEDPKSCCIAALQSQTFDFVRYYGNDEIINLKSRGISKELETISLFVIAMRSEIAELKNEIEILQHRTKINEI